jgi:polysaccharide chain length determinant protein (PEP-CTERM system associated)
MKELRAVVLKYAHVAWRRRWHLIGCVWAICALGWAIIWQIPDYYESSARVYVNSDESLTPLLNGIALGSDETARQDRLQRTILSATNINKVIEMTDLDLRIQDPADRQQMVAHLQKAIVVKPQTHQLFTISYDDVDPKIAESVVSSVLSLFIEASASDSRSDIDSAQRFLQSEIDRLETNLREDEHKKAEFESRYYDLLPSEESGLSKLDQAQAHVSSLTQDLNDAVAEQDSLQKQLDGQPKFIADPRPATMPKDRAGLSVSPRRRLAQLQAQLEVAKATMTDAHPVVIALKHQIALVNAKLAKMATTNQITVSPGMIANPTYGDLTIKLADKSVGVAELRQRLGDAVKNLDTLEEEARQAPGIAAEYTNLSRDYDIVKKNYEDLLQRREAAEIGENAERKGHELIVKTIDPPEVPILAAGPNRLLLISIVLVGGIGAGIGLAFILSEMDTSFSTTTSLQVFPFPVLGSIAQVEAIETRRSRRFRGWGGFAPACAMLIAAYFSLLIIAARHSDL